MMKPSEEALAKARKAFERTKELFDAFKDHPEPKCSICGRVIYCGVNSLCKEEPCGLKGK